MCLCVCVCVVLTDWLTCKVVAVAHNSESVCIQSPSSLSARWINFRLNAISNCLEWWMRDFLPRKWIHARTNNEFVCLPNEALKLLRSPFTAKLNVCGALCVHQAIASVCFVSFWVVFCPVALRSHRRRHHQRTPLNWKMLPKYGDTYLNKKNYDFVSAFIPRLVRWVNCSFRTITPKDAHTHGCSHAIEHAGCFAHSPFISQSSLVYAARSSAFWSTGLCIWRGVNYIKTIFGWKRNKQKNGLFSSPPFLRGSRRTNN